MESTERRAQLNALKLAAVVRDAVAPVDPHITPATFPGGAASIVDGEAWVLLDERPSIGAALAWATRLDAESVHVVAETDTGILARRAAAFAHPVRVSQLDGRTLAPAIAERLPDRVVVRPEHLALADLIEAGGATLRIEHGVVVGEVVGLEVCRVVDDEMTGAPRLEVGVGAHDREAFGLLHGEVPTVEALAGVVEAVRRHRQADAPPHPLNRLGAERALREAALGSPASIGAATLLAEEPPVPRANVKDPVPCVAVGSTSQGRPLVAVFSTGIDLDLVPFAADARRRHAAQLTGDTTGDEAGIELVIVVPERDRHPVTVTLSRMLRHPAEVMAWPH